MSYLAFERAVVRWTRRLALLAGWILLAIGFLTVADATLRYGFNRPLPGTFELTELVLAVIIFFGLPYTGLIDGHVAVDILTARLSPRAQHAFIAVTSLVVAALLGVITWEITRLADEFLRTNRTTITARIPVLPFAVPVALAAALATLTAVLQAVGALCRMARPELGPMPAPER